MKAGYSGRGGAILASGLVLLVAGAFLVYGAELRKGRFSTVSSCMRSSIQRMA